MNLTPLEAVTAAAITGGVVVWAWADLKITELRDALGSLPGLYAEAQERADDALADLASATVENAQLRHELTDTADLADHARAEAARLRRALETRDRADTAGIRSKSTAGLVADFEAERTRREQQRRADMAAHPSSQTRKAGK